MYRRFLRLTKDIHTEVLIATDLIWKIEVGYCGRNADGEPVTTVLRAKDESPTAFRKYTIHVGNDRHEILADPPSEASAILDRIYHDSIPYPPGPPM